MNKRKRKKFEKQLERIGQETTLTTQNIFQCVEKGFYKNMRKKAVILTTAFYMDFVIHEIEDKDIQISVFKAIKKKLDKLI